MSFKKPTQPHILKWWTLADVFLGQNLGIVSRNFSACDQEKQMDPSSRCVSVVIDEGKLSVFDAVLIQHACLASHECIYFKKKIHIFSLPFYVRSTCRTYYKFYGVPTF